MGNLGELWLTVMSCHGDPLLLADPSTTHRY